MVWLVHPSDPVYGGKTLPDWFSNPDLQYIGLMPDSPAGPAGITPAFQAILCLRGDAVPFLSHIARKQPSRFAGTYQKMRNRLPSAILRVLPPSQSVRDVRLRQTRALVMLGALIYWEDRPRNWGAESRALEYPAIVSTLRRCFDDPDTSVRSTAATAAGYLGPKGRSLVPDLLKFVRGTNATDKVAAAAALGLIGDGTVVPDLANLLPAPGGGINPLVVWAIGLLRPEGTNAIPLLVNLIPKAKDAERMRIAAALGDLECGSKAALDGLVSILKTDDMFAQREAALAMVQIGITPPEAIPQLCELTNSRRALQVRQAATLALWNHAREDQALIVSVSNVISESPISGLAWMYQSRMATRAGPLVPLLRSLTNAYRKEAQTR